MMLKRVLDIVVSLAALIILSPLLLLVALLVARNLGRPVLFKQVRPGLHGRPFTILKFRTMRDATDENGNPLGEVVLLATVGGETKEYRGRIVRTEGEIDRSSRSAYLVAEVEGGTGGDQARPRLRPGLFVQARIAGRPLPHCARIPFSAFVGLERVAIVAPDNTLQFRDVTVVHRDEESVYISGGLEENTLVCLTELPAMIIGEEVVPRPAADDGIEEPAPQPAL